MAPGKGPLRVLWLADKLGYGDHIHGLGQYYLTVAPAMRNAEVIPGVLRSTNGLSNHLAASGVRLQEFRGGVWNPRTLWTLVHYVRREQVDLLHVHGYGSAAVGRIVGWLTRRPVLMHQHDSVTRPWAIQLVDRALSGLTAHTIAVSESVRMFCTAARALPLERVSVLPLAIRPPREAAHSDLARWRSQRRVPEGAKLIGSITRFHPVKGTGFLLEAFPEVLRAIPEAHLVLWGDGPEHESLEAKTRMLGVADRVRFEGHQPDAAQHLALLDCFVLPSLSEGFPFALLEAMMAGRPIVATSVGGVPEMIRHGQEALLVAPQDPQALAAAITCVLTDPALARRLGQSAKAASARYSIERHVAALRRLYEEVVNVEGHS